MTVSTQGRRRATRWGEGCGGSRICGPRFPFLEAEGCAGSGRPPALRLTRLKPRRKAGTSRQPLRRAPLPSLGRATYRHQLQAKDGQTLSTASLTSRAGREEQPPTSGGSKNGTGRRRAGQRRRDLRSSWRGCYRDPAGSCGFRVVSFASSHLEVSGPGARHKRSWESF